MKPAFLQLPIPFACVAADMFHREEIVMKGGNLVQAMRRVRQNPNDDDAFWQPAPLLARLADEGKTFN